MHRVLNRIGIVTTKTPLETDKKAASLFDAADLAPLHNSLVLFGRYHCTARNPKCESCRIREVCHFGQKNL